jgi:hypothetical protein
MPAIDHDTLMQNIWVVASIAIGGGGFATQFVGMVHGDLGFGIKILIGAGISLIIFGTMYFFAPAAGA